jgi:hypothetical protein
MVLIFFSLRPRLRSASNAAVATTAIKPNVKEPHNWTNVSAIPWEREEVLQLFALYAGEQNGKVGGPTSGDPTGIFDTIVLLFHPGTSGLIAAFKHGGGVKW